MFYMTVNFEIARGGSSSFYQLCSRTVSLNMHSDLVLLPMKVRTGAQ